MPANLPARCASWLRSQLPPVRLDRRRELGHQSRPVVPEDGEDEAAPWTQARARLRPGVRPALRQSRPRRRRTAESRRLENRCPSTSRGRVAPTRVLLVACFGAFLAFLDATIVNVAFPSIRESFPEASIGALSWVLNAYNIVFAAFLVVCGRLTDLIGRRRAFVGGIALFTLASAVVRGGRRPWSSSSPPGCCRRWARRCSCRRRWPSSSRRSRSDRRAHAIGLWGATAAVAAGLGPPMGGASSSSAAGAGRSWSTCRSACSPSWPRAARSWRAARPGRRDHARPARCAAARGRPGRC